MTRRSTTVAVVAVVVSLAVIMSLLIGASAAQAAKGVKGRRESAQQQQQQQQPRTPPSEPLDESNPLLGAPVVMLADVDDFTRKVQQAVLPAMLFIGDTRNTPADMRSSITIAAASMASHVVSYAFDMKRKSAREFARAIGLPKDHPKDLILMINPEFVKAEGGGFYKIPAQYNGPKTPYAITRFFLAMASREHIDEIDDLADLVAFRKKYAHIAALPKVILVTGTNLTSPMFVSVGHQFRVLAQFGVIARVPRAAHELATAAFEADARAMKKSVVADLAPGSDDAAAAAAAAALGEGGADAAAVAEMQRSAKVKAAYGKRFRTLATPEEDAQAAASDPKLVQDRAELLKLLGVLDVPAIVLASADLSDVTVHSGSNMTQARLHELVAEHALSSDQWQGLFEKIFTEDDARAKDREKRLREYKANKGKKGGSGDSNNAKPPSAEPIEAFHPILVNTSKQWQAACPSASSGGVSTLCVVAFGQAVPQSVLQYADKVDELAKGVKKIQLANRLGYTRVRFVLFDVDDAGANHLELARFLGAGGGVFPSVVFVNPSKGTYHNHVGSFTGASMADFALSRMKGIRAKVYSKDALVEKHFVAGDDDDAAAADDGAGGDGDAFAEKKRKHKQQRKRANDEEARQKRRDEEDERADATADAARGGSRFDDEVIAAEED